MALVGNDFYVANTDAVVRFPYEEGQTEISEPGEKVVDLPAGPINHHWTKNLIASPDGSLLYATVGSNSNVAENGIDGGEGRAAIWEIDPRDRPLSRVRIRPAQSQWHGLGAGDRRALDRGERARRNRQRPGARLHDLGQGRRLLRLALQLFRPACRRARASRRGPIWWRRRSCRTTRSGRTRPRSASPSPTATACRRPSRAAPSSASTAPGTASRTAATR